MFRFHPWCVVSPILATAVSLLPVTARAQTEMVIDWSVCQQPDLGSNSHQKAVRALIDQYVNQAKAKFSSSHIAVRLNKIYGVLVQDRRDHVQLNYVPVSTKRTENECALSPGNYAKLIAFRDASYYILCRSEVGIGTSAADRAAKDMSTLAAASIYDLIKKLGVDLRAKKDEPTTPPGGFAACGRGAADGAKDPFPTADDVKEFKSRMSLSAEERAQIGDPSKQ